jgi:hypothetical protein
MMFNSSKCSSSLTSLDLNSRCNSGTTCVKDASVTLEELPSWEGSLYFPLSLYHFSVSLKNCTAIEIVDDISLFLQNNNDCVSFKFDLSNFKWECALYDGSSVVKFDINILLDDQKGEIIIEWNKLSGNSGKFTKLFKENQSSFLRQFQPEERVTDDITSINEMIPLPFEDDGNFIEESIEQLQNLVHIDTVSAISILASIISNRRVSENTLVDNALEEFNKIVSILIQSLQNGGDWTEYSLFLLNQYSETYLLCLEIIKTRIITLLTSKNSNVLLKNDRFLGNIQNTIHTSNDLYKIFASKGGDTHYNLPSVDTDVVVNDVFSPLLKLAHQRLHSQISNLLTPVL